MQSNSDPQLITLPTHADARGYLVVAEAADLLPFRFRRVFFILDPPPPAKRGQHAHRLCHQAIICVRGGVDVKAGRFNYRLIQPHIALHIPPGNYIELSGFMPGTVLLVLCSEHYDANDYVLDPEDFSL